MELEHKCGNIVIVNNFELATAQFSLHPEQRAETDNTPNQYQITNSYNISRNVTSLRRTRGTQNEPSKRAPMPYHLYVSAHAHPLPAGTPYLGGRRNRNRKHKMTRHKTPNLEKPFAPTKYLSQRPPEFHGPPSRHSKFTRK